MAEMIMGVEGLDSSAARMVVANALFKYSGVLDVNVSPGGEELRVRYEPSNILAGDIRETVVSVGCRVKWVKD
jgi:hypothetical protein